MFAPPKTLETSVPFLRNACWLYIQMENAVRGVEHVTRLTVPDTSYSGVHFYPYLIRHTFLRANASF